MAPQPTLLDRPLLGRPGPMAPPPPMDWMTLGDAFEVACLLRCTPPPATGRGPVEPYRPAAEFNRQDAALRMRQLLTRLDVPVQHEVVSGGLRRRYELHRLHVPEEHRATYAELCGAGWRRGRRELLAGPVAGASSARVLWRGRLAAAAWRSALLAGGRHVRRHILGIRLTDRELAAVLVRSAALLEVPALLRPGAGCLVVSVADGPDRLRIIERAALARARPAGRP
ncbi:hypothetical protein [Micromonospora sp. KC213]|uniref:hypothetical protein n=1 Tax=Micromonospora sp. KC213 TaxID=2530378 RepID=UPI00105190B1|nr:hypothetical protein [Micromonospora sp. KC213]TDC32867.1 hypothetical protein E1166_26335 [Micromonospora sp. KC213]